MYMPKDIHLYNFIKEFWANYSVLKFVWMVRIPTDNQFIPG